MRAASTGLAIWLAAGQLAFAGENPAGKSSSEVAATLAAHPAWALRLPEDGMVPFRGNANFDGAGGGATPMLYPAPNAVGLLAAVFTHGILVDSSKRREKEKLQEDADKVLDPYRPVLKNFGYRELQQGALEKAVALGAHATGVETEGHGADVWIESAPVFTIARDQRAIVLDNQVIIHTQSGNYQNTVRIVSPPRKEPNPEGAWTAAEGTALKDECERLLAASLMIAMDDAASAPADGQQANFKTVRYQEGGSVKMERAQVLHSQCDRLVIRTLRGELMAVPPHQADSGDGALKCSEVSP